MTLFKKKKIAELERQVQSLTSRVEWLEEYENRRRQAEVEEAKAERQKKIERSEEERRNRIRQIDSCRHDWRKTGGGVWDPAKVVLQCRSCGITKEGNASEWS